MHILSRQLHSDFYRPINNFFPVHDVCISSKWVQPFILSWSSYILRTGLSEKATKYEEISTFIFDTKYISNFKWNLEISSNVSGFLRIYELYMLNRIIQNRNKIFGSFMAVLLPTFKSNSFNLGDCKKSRQNHFWIVCKKKDAICQLTVHPKLYISSTIDTTRIVFPLIGSSLE